MRSNTQELEKILILTESDRAHFFYAAVYIKMYFGCAVFITFLQFESFKVYSAFISKTFIHGQKWQIKTNFQYFRDNKLF